MTITTDGIVAACAGLLTISAVIGLAVRFILVPYLRAALVEPMAVRLAVLEGKLDAVVHETRPNGGTSMKDALRRIEQNLENHIVSGRAETDAMWHVLDGKGNE